MLLEFYNLQRLDLLIPNIRALVDGGLTSIHKAQLGVLLSLLQNISERISI